MTKANVKIALTEFEAIQAIAALNIGIDMMIRNDCFESEIDAAIQAKNKVQEKWSEVVRKS